MYIKTAFGYKPLVYCDYTASGRGIQVIEDYIQEEILPVYANTHSDGSWTSIQTNAFREESRNIIRDKMSTPLTQMLLLSMEME
jgi:selenocysteine lyase/cysteine desulfurase